MRIIVNSLDIECGPDVPLLKALLAAGVELPTLCYHPALGADGRCGLCVVEIFQNGRWELRLACQAKPSPDLQVRTDTERVCRARAQSAGLLLKYAPFQKPNVWSFLLQIAMTGRPEPDPVLPVSDLETSDGSASETGCILCGLCVRACAQTGRGFLTFAGKGRSLKIRSWPGSTDCGRCRACIAVCPTGFMDLETKTQILIEW